MHYMFIMSYSSQLHVYYVIALTTQSHLTWTGFMSCEILPSQTHSTRDTLLFSQYPPQSNTFDLGYLFVFKISSKVECVRLGTPFYSQNILQSRTHSTRDTFSFPKQHSKVNKF